MEKEIWKDINGYEGLYKISSYGKVLSLSKKFKNNATSDEIILKNTLDYYGFDHVFLYKNKTEKVCKIHTLVAKHFIDNNNNYTHLLHKDLNKRNNNKNNIVWASKEETTHTQKKQKNRSSKFKGVCWHKNAQKWVAYITKKRKTIYLGCFENEKDAALAYNENAITLFSKFARLNKI